MSSALLVEGAEQNFLHWQADGETSAGRFDLTSTLALDVPEYRDTLDFGRILVPLIPEGNRRENNLFDDSFLTLSDVQIGLFTKPRGGSEPQEESQTGEQLDESLSFLSVQYPLMVASTLRPEKAPLVVKQKAPSVAPSVRFRVLQKWEGVVLERHSDYFLARLFDRSGERPQEEGEFEIDEIFSEDRELIEQGAVFYWKVGYHDSRSGRIRVSEIRFRRLPTWTEEELEQSSQEATALARGLEWHL